MASFEQDLEDDEYLPEISQTNEEAWTCKKCTLVNSSRVKACVVCGGSKLKSVSCVEDMTLRKGEFWTCGQCTLKNSLSIGICIACKAVRQIPIISGQQTNFRPYTSSPAQPNSKLATAASNSAAYHNHHHHPTHHNRPLAANNVIGNNTVAAASNAFPGGQTQSNNSLVPPAHRISRSPSPKHDRSNIAASAAASATGSSGAIPKVL